MGLAHVGLGLVLVWTLYLTALTLDRVKRLTAQMAVLTLREAELAETVEALDTIIRTERHRAK